MVRQHAPTVETLDRTQPQGTVKGIQGLPGLGTRSLLKRPQIIMNYLPGEIQKMRNALFPPFWQQCLSRLNHRLLRGFQIVHACKPGMLFLCCKWLRLGPHNWTVSLSWKSHSQSRLLTKSGPEYKPLSSMHWPPLHPCWRQIPKER